MHMGEGIYKWSSNYWKVWSCKTWKKKLFQFSYGIMADRGIMVQYPFANLDVYVNTPTLLSGRSQLEPNRLVKYRRMTSKRIHIERNIGLAKRYKIMSKEMYQKVGFNLVLELYIFALPGKYQRHHCRQICMSPSPM